MWREVLLELVQCPNMRAKNPPWLALASAICAEVCLPPHHWDAGTVRFTS